MPERPGLPFNFNLLLVTFAELSLESSMTEIRCKSHLSGYSNRAFLAILYESQEKTKHTLTF